MYYALTLKNNIITGVHGSLSVIEQGHFALNPEFANDTVIPISGEFDYVIGMDIRCYNEDGIMKSEVWCIEQGYLPLPPNKEIINGELVDIMLPPEQQPITIAEFISAEIAAIKDEQSRVVTELQRDQNLALDLIRTNEETTIAQVREEQKQAIAAVKDEQIQAVEAVRVEHVQKIDNMKPLMTELVRGKPPDVVIGTTDFILPWEQGKYVLDDVRLWDGQPRRCCQAHDSTGNPDWTPAMASLWAPFHATRKDLALDWVQPAGAHDMYKAGEYMVWTDDKVYKCKQDTAYSPVEYAAAWGVIE